MLSKYAVLLDEYIKSVITEESLNVKDDTIDSASVSDGYIDVKYENGKHRKLRPGKAIREIIKDSIPDHKLGDLVNRILYRYKRDQYKQQYQFKIVNNVEYYYRHDRTVMENELGNSCMIYDPEDKFKNLISGYDNEDILKNLKWYSKNGVRLLVLLNNDDKVVARTILWDVTKHPNPSDTVFTVHDRIYHSSEETKEMMIEYLKSNNIKFIRDIGKVYFKIKDPNHGHNPYFDSMRMEKKEKGYIESFPKCIDAIRLFLNGEDLSIEKIFEVYRDTEIIGALKKVPKTDEDIYTILIESILMDEFKIVKYILSSFSIDDFLSSPRFIDIILSIAKSSRGMDKLRDLINAGFDININNGIVLKKVIENNNYVLVLKFIDLGADINIIPNILNSIASDKIFTALMNLGLNLNKKDVLQYLNNIRSSYDRSLRDLYVHVFSYSLRRKLINEEEVVDLLMNTDDESLMRGFFSELIDNSTGQEFINSVIYGIDPKILSERMFMYLFSVRSPDFIFDWLLKHDVDLKFIYRKGISTRETFAWSSKNNNFSFFKNSSEIDKNRYFKLAAGWGYTRVVEFLIKEGVDITSPSNFFVGGALIDAALQGNLGIVKLLIDSGINPEYIYVDLIKDVENKGHHHIANILKSKL